MAEQFKPEVRLTNSQSPDQDWDSKHDPCANLYLDVECPSWKQMHRSKRPVGVESIIQISPVPLHITLGHEATPRMLWLAANEQGVSVTEVVLHLSSK